MNSIHNIGQTMDRLEPFLDELDAIGRFGLSAYNEYHPLVRIDHSPRTAANCVYDHMAAEADRRFADHPEVNAIDVRGLRLWVLGGRDPHTVFRFKKMDQSGATKNYPTQQIQDFDLMRDLPGLPEKPTRVVVGYVADALFTIVDRVQVARPNGSKIDWCAAIVSKQERNEVESRWMDVTSQVSFTG